MKPPRTVANAIFRSFFLVAAFTLFLITFKP
jgi:hypothetical protein